MTTKVSPPLSGESRALARQQHLAVVRERAFNLVLGASILAFGAVAAGGLVSQAHSLASDTGVAEAGEHNERYVKIISSNTSSHRSHTRTRSS